jgi:pyruvate,water dikinase
MLDPITPLGGDFMRAIFAAGASLFGYKLTADTQTVLHWAGERLWADFTTLMRNSVGRKGARGALTLVEPSVRQALLRVWDDPRLQPQKQGISPGGIFRLAHFFPGLVFNVLLNLAAPERRRAYIVQKGERVLRALRGNLAAVSGSRGQKLAERLRVVERTYFKALPEAFPLFVSGVAAGMVPFNLLNNLANSLSPAGSAPRAGWNDLALEVTRGLPNNPTTEMDLDLWQTAQAIHRDPPSLQDFQSMPAADLAGLYHAGKLPAAAQAAIERFLERYGMRGLAEIDLGRPRWSENAVHVIQVLGSYLQIEDANMAPDAVFARGAASAARAVETLAAGLRKTRHGWMKGHIARAAARRVRALLGVRESPKFFAVRLFGEIRMALLDSGREYVQAGVLEQAEDIVFLSMKELDALAGGETRDWKALIAKRQAAYHRELKRRQIPRLLLSDGRAFYEGMANGENGANTLTGSPVSPGVVEGPVHVILDPRGAQLLPGEILVCPGTDPSWTPLFLAAGGLIMEVGGMMTHGAVVAREYGIPAAVGVHQATTRLSNGQRIRLDGSSGKITLL